MEGSKDDVELESMLTDEGLMLDIIFNASSATGTGTNAFSGHDPFFTGSMSANYGNGNGNLASNSCLGQSLVPFPNAKDMYYKNTMNADFIQPGKTSSI
jgi:hypothetical protein